MFNQEHKFKTEKQNQKGSIMRFICAFLAFALVFGSISAVVILKHNNVSLKDIFSKKNTQTETQTDVSETQVIPKEIGGSANFLLYCTSKDGNELYFTVIVTADMDGKTFKVRPVNPDVPEYISEYKKGGYKSLVAAVEKHENVKIDKYVASDRDTFALAINYMDGLEYAIDKRVEYRTSEFTLILTRGNQTIKGETLMKYFRYAKTLGNEGLKIQGDLICAMLDNYINSENTEKGLKIYQRVLSKINSDSDISYIEASKGIEALKVLCRSEDRKPATIVLNTQ